MTIKIFQKSITTAAILFCATSLHSESVIRVSGSDLLAGVLDPIIAEFETETGSRCELTLQGTILAKKALLADDADIAIIALPEGRSFSVPSYELFPFAYLAAAIVVNENNPIQEITLPQLVNIYADVGGKQITEWGQLGLSGIWQPRPVNPYISGDDKGIAAKLFAYSIYSDGQDQHSRILSIDSSRTLLDNVKDHAEAIAITRAPIKYPGVRTIPIASGTGDRLDYSFLPDEDSLTFGDYPLRLHIMICYSPVKGARVSSFLRKLYEAPTPALLLENGFIPAAERERERVLLDLDIGG